MDQPFGQSVSVSVCGCVSALWTSPLVSLYLWLCVDLFLRACICVSVCLCACVSVYFSMCVCVSVCVKNQTFLVQRSTDPKRTFVARQGKTAVTDDATEDADRAGRLSHLASTPRSLRGSG